MLNHRLVGFYPDQTVWYLLPHLHVDPQEVTALAKEKAAFIVATNVLDAERLTAEQMITTYKEQGGVERGFRFLKDPLFLASSIFVKKTRASDRIEFCDGPLFIGLSTC